MNIKEIRQLIKLMIDNDLTEVDLANGEEKISLKRGLSGPPTVMVSPPQIMPTAVEAVPAAESGPSAPEETPTETFLEIKSPMVGTYYAASSPDGEPFIQVGQAVSSDTVVCIVEAMKVMNEIKAECSGTIVEVCGHNTQPVEFGQVLFRVRP